MSSGAWRSGFAATAGRCGWALADRSSSEGTHVADGSIDGGPQRLWIARDVGEHRAALMCGDQRHGQMPWVGVGAQVAAITHRLEAGPKKLDPLVVARREV